MTDPIPKEVRERAEAIVSSGLAGDELVRSQGEIGVPIPVHQPTGGVHSWFIPVTVGEKLAGFLQLLPDLVLMRYSSFQRREGSLEGCPDASLWIDSETIRATALAEARPGEELDTPLLSFDRSPSRLAWAVPAVDSEGNERRIFVAGETAWAETAGGEDCF